MNRAVLAFLAITIPFAAFGDPVRTDLGLVSGGLGDNPSVHVYKGIPYAAAPVGDRRWKKPQTPAAWTGVREAKEFSAPCMQVPYPQTSIYYSALGSVSEDCLYLNIWTTSEKARLPVMLYRRDFVEAGCLMSYGIVLPDMYRRAAAYVDKILKGTKQADIPGEQPTKFELVINLKTAKALGLTVPRLLLGRADEVIE